MCCRGCDGRDLYAHSITGSRIQGSEISCIRGTTNKGGHVQVGTTQQSPSRCNRTVHTFGEGAKSETKSMTYRPALEQRSNFKLKQAGGDALMH